MNGRRSPILEAGLAVSSGPVLMFSVYLLAAGHNQPGGGFAGGLVAGVAILLAWAAGGQAMVGRIIPVRASVLLGLGLVISALTGFSSLAVGLGFLESGYIELSVPVVGDVKAVSALAFDAGVYLVVVGMSLGMIRSLGEGDTGGDR